MADIGVRNIQKRFGEFVAVHDSSFTIQGGEFFVMLGPSGCGKTTTLRMIAGLEMPTSGQILFDGEDVTNLRASRRDIAFMFQLFALYPHMKVYDNIAFPLKCHGVPRRERRRRVQETAALLRIEHFLHQRVSALAGGDRQRVALGRAIVREPKAFLMDEPLGALDAEMRELMCGELRTLHDRLNATTLYVTHDQIEAMSMADRIIVMNHGVIEQIGSPQEIYDRPRTMFVADFIGSPSMSFLRFEGAVEVGQSSVDIGGAVVDVPKCPAGPLALGVRPEQVHCDSSESAPSTCAHGPARARASAPSRCGAGSATPRRCERLRCFGTRRTYLGTNQIVTVETDHGQMLGRACRRTGGRSRARASASSARPIRLVVFDASRRMTCNNTQSDIIPAKAGMIGPHGAYSNEPIALPRKPE